MLAIRLNKNIEQRLQRLSEKTGRTKLLCQGSYSDLLARYGRSLFS